MGRTTLLKAALSRETPAYSKHALCSLSSTSFLAIAAISLFATSAQAQSEWTGVVSSDWSASINWIGGVPTQQRDAIINTVTSPTVISSNPNAQARSLQVGSNATGSLTVQDNSSLIVFGNGYIGNLPGGVGTVTVTGLNSHLQFNSPIVVGGQGTGFLDIADGATMNSIGGSVGLATGSNGTVTVSGSGSTWFNGTGGGLNIGSFGTGTLTIEDGGKVFNLTAFTVANIGNGATGTGTVTVTGANSIWSNVYGLNIGNFGTGTLTIADGGIVSGLGGPIVIAAKAGSTGTLNIGAGAAPGILLSPTLALGAGNGTLNFNHNSSDYVFVPDVSGAGAVNVIAGTTIFTGDNTYTGGTTISGGTLQIGDGGTSGSIAGDVLNNSLFIVKRSDAFIYGGVISGWGAFQQSGAGTTIFTGNNTYSGGTTISGGTLQMGDGGASGSIVGDVLDNGVFSIRRSDTFSFGGVISGPGAFEQNGPGTTILTGANTYFGPTEVNAGVLQAGGLATLSPNSDVTVASGGTLGLNGFNQTLISLTNGGVVSFGAAAPPFTELTTANYTGTGGLLEMNSFLDVDGSPSDKLIIDGGSATGTTTVLVRNAGGAGALTTGDGILLIDAENGTTSPDAFDAALAIAGPYEYRLVRGNQTGTLPDNWYLRSGADEPPTPDKPPTPNYRREVSLYSAIPPMAAIYGRHLLATLHERVGEEEQLRGRTDLGVSGGAFSGAWGRVMGQHGHRDGDPIGIYGAGGPEFDYDFGALQLGLDVYGHEKMDGTTDRAGIYGAYGQGEVDVQHQVLGRRFEAGTDSFDAKTFGAYWTRFWKNNAYLDSVIQSTWYAVTPQSHRNAVFDLPKVDGSGFGFAASLEGGYPFDFGDGWQIEPQGQLIYQTVDMGSFSDSAATVDFDNLDALTGRLGGRVARTWEVGLAANDKTARLATVWGSLSLWHEFLGATSTTSFSSETGPVPFTAELADNWMEVSIGGSLQIAASATIYGNLDFEAAFDGGDYGIGGGNLGLRMNW
jgi:outer membrane autotransporter protein